MSFFFEFPHTRTYDDDLGWLIWAMQKLIGEMTEFTEINSIKFADPINWNIATQYEPTTIVIDDDGNGYISRKAVPAGVALTDGEYWTRIFNFSQITENLTNGIAYNNGSQATAGKAFLKNELVWFNNKIYRVLYDIAAGTALLPGTNIAETTFAQYVLEIETEVEETTTALNARMDTLTALVNTTMQEVVTITTELQENVNQQISALQGNVNQQINTLQGSVDRQLTDFQQGVDADLATMEQQLSQQITQEISSIIGDFNDGIGGALNGKRIAVLGDSLTIGSGNALGKTWVENLATDYGAITYNYGVSGSKISSGGSGSTPNDMVNRIDAILNTHATLDYFILMGGANDKNENVPIGTPNSTDNQSFIGAIKNIISKVRLKYGGACKILLMTTYHRYDTFNTIGNNEWDYVQAMIMSGNYWSIPVFNNYNNCGIALNHPAEYPTADEWADIYYATGTQNRGHFSVEGYKYLTPIYANFIVNGFNTNANGPLVYETIGNTVFMKTDLPNGLSLISFRHYFNSTIKNAAGSLIFTDDLDIVFPEKFKVYTPMIATSCYGVQGFGLHIIRNLDIASGGILNKIVFRATRIGAATNSAISGYISGTAIGFRK